MTMKILVLGGASGDVGRDVTRILLRNKNYIEHITVTSRNLDTAQKFVKEIDDQRVSAMQVDVTNQQQLKDAMCGHNLVLNTVGPFSKYAIPVIKAAIEFKVNYIDICDDIEPTIEALQLDQIARNAGIFILLSMGWFPGMSNLRAKALADKMDEVEEIVTAWVGGRKAAEEKPSLGLAGTEHFFRCISGNITTFREGRRVRIPSYHKGIQLDFPEPLGPFICYQMEHPEPITLPYVILGVQTASNLWALYPPIRNRFVRLFTRAIDFKILSPYLVTKFFIMLGQTKGKKTLPVLTASYISCIGIKDGKKGQMCYSAVNTKITVAEATSQPLSCAVLHIASGGKIEPGVHLPETALKIEDIIKIGTRKKLPFVKDVIEEMKWSDDVISLK